MDNILSSTPNRFEILPNEIFLEIFKYLKPIDLISFIGHNPRINDIIHKSFLPIQFIRLKFCYPWDALNLHLYTKLRSLKLDYTRLLQRQYSQCHMSLKYLRIILVNPFNDLEKILPYMPNLEELRVTGMIRERSILYHFKKLSEIFHIYTSNLKKFDCELYCDETNEQVDILIIQQLHPLFKMIQCHEDSFFKNFPLGNRRKYCYATDLMEYTIFKEREYYEQITRKPAEYYPVLSGYDSGEYYDHNDDLF
ncbi:unnamed protein product [Rotaria sordida]|uniref:F-box domain-containing protein n=2 Tax=Rotaria sordida TaxID=392033 RepID=A0A814N0E9_9BILA|nr:unnamed protein product [Rotaria sordida]CAF1278317.1 unnamed protein product [Rotaria sordida]